VKGEFITSTPKGRLKTEKKKPAPVVVGAVGSTESPRPQTGDQTDEPKGIQVEDEKKATGQGSRVVSLTVWKYRPATEGVRKVLAVVASWRGEELGNRKKPEWHSCFLHSALTPRAENDARGRQGV